MMGSRRAQAASESQVGSPASEAPSTSRSSGLLPFDGIIPEPHPSVSFNKPAPLSAEQESKYQEVLSHFKSIKDYPVSFKADAEKKPLNEWETLRLLTRESMLRYLRATKWDVTQAKKRLTETIIWRREYGVDSLDPSYLEPEAETGKETILGFDNKGRPLHYMHPNRNTTKESPRQMQFAVWILERAIDLMPPGVEQLALLINFGGKKGQPTSISNAKLMLYILQNHYVERLGIALCINVPWIFKAFWNAIYPFIDPVTKSKCKFDEAIKQEVPGSHLAADFGGEVDFTYDHDRYWPDLIKLSDKRREEQLRRFREQCNSEIGASEWVIRGGEEASASRQDSGYEETTLVASQQKLLAKAEKQVSYHAVTDNDDDADAGLDRFVTSSEELPPSLSGSESNTVTEERSDAKTGDKSLFAAMVGGVSAGLVGGAAGVKAADQAWVGARQASEQHDKVNHIDHQAAVAARSGSPRPISAA